MELTKQKLYELIIEQMKPRDTSMNQKVFDKRRQYPKGGTIRAFGDENQPINRPDLQDKLTALGSSGPEGYNQALDLADTLDEPLDIEHDPSKMRARSIFNPILLLKCKKNFGLIMLCKATQRTL